MRIARKLIPYFYLEILLELALVRIFPKATMKSSDGLEGFEFESDMFLISLDEVETSGASAQNLVPTFEMITRGNADLSVGTTLASTQSRYQAW